MPFLAVGPHQVFLSIDRWGALNRLALANKPHNFIVQSMFADSPEKREADKLRIECLESLFASDSQKFEAEWVGFRWQDEEAKENVSRLIWDWCVLRKAGRIEQARGAVNTVLATSGNTFLYPYGMKFALIVPMPRTLKEIVLFRPARRLRYLIDVAKVVEICGRLTSFVVKIDSFTLSFDEAISLTDSLAPNHNEAERSAGGNGS